MMFKQCLINKIISNKLHFTVEKEDSEQGNKTWIEIETLQQYNDDIDAFFEKEYGDALERQNQE